jgi:Leucine-rich repeat (LRR) protein
MLSLVEQDLKQIREKDKANGGKVQHLDVSFNQLSQGADFAPFTNLLTLVIDDNLFTSLRDFPVLKLLETLSANKNGFSDLSSFLEDGHDRFGQLRNLSLLKNPLNPFFEGEQKYDVYRDHILGRFPNLKTLDGITMKVMRLTINEKKKEEEQKYEKLTGVAVFD